MKFSVRLSVVHVLLALIIPCSVLADHPQQHIQVPDDDPLEPAVDYVELDRYVGTWYEIASIPQPFSRGCKNTQAQYIANDEGGIDVTNSCTLKIAGETLSISGVAVPNDSSNTKLTLTLDGVPPGNYWILDVGKKIGKNDDPYPWAIVGEPTRQSCFILSRHKKITPQMYQSLLNKVAQFGYDPNSLVKTIQNIK